MSRDKRINILKSKEIFFVLKFPLFKNLVSGTRCRICSFVNVKGTQKFIHLKFRMEVDQLHKQLNLMKETSKSGDELLLVIRLQTKQACYESIVCANFSPTKSV